MTSASPINCRLRAGLLLAALAFLPLAAQAGRGCEAQHPSVESVGRGLELAAQTLKELEASDAQVVLLARAGQDLERFGLRYSHLGFAYREAQQDGSQRWRVLHKLNRCGSDRASLYLQGLGEFFLDDLWRFEAAWVVPTAEVQIALLNFLQDPQRRLSMHHRRYSVVSYPWSQRYQQSNQWAIETLAVAMQPAITDRVQAQAWLRAQGYRPSVLRLGPLTRLGGQLGSANIAFDDHPNAKRFSNRIETVTVDSVFDWLQRAGLAERREQLLL